MTGERTGDWATANIAHIFKSRPKGWSKNCRPWMSFTSTLARLSTLSPTTPLHPSLDLTVWVDGQLDSLPEDQKQAEYCKGLSWDLTNISISDLEEVMQYAVKFVDDTNMGDQLICKGRADVQKDLDR
ncbi:hypothetical protein QYF61_001353 [Mycteria americana]|uniref:Uncharacterized protein n=1 Tax=Mycteria americana TaxID=33587 RepID=A0AAN7NGR5_MYCAM|nr:hypothetical protein QYF61_001353 [Mycteria americana]